MGNIYEFFLLELYLPQKRRFYTIFFFPRGFRRDRGDWVGRDRVVGLGG